MTLLFLAALSVSAQAAGETAEEQQLSPCLKAVREVAAKLDEIDSHSTSRPNQYREAQLKICYPDYTEGRADYKFSLSDLQKQLSNVDRKFGTISKDVQGPSDPGVPGGPSAAPGGPPAAPGGPSGTQTGQPSGNICGASPEQKAKIEKGFKGYQENELIFRKLVDGLQERKDFFGRMVTRQGPSPDPTLCRRSADSAKLVKGLLEQAYTVCKSTADGDSQLGDRIAVLRGRLRRGCNPPKSHCELKQKGETHDVHVPKDASLYRVWYADGDSYVPYTEGTESQKEALRILRRCKLENDQQD